MNNTKTFRAVFCLLVLSLFATVAQAHPYASAITNNSGNIQFILNESADNVSVTFDNNTSTNDLGALTLGAHSFALGAHTNYSIIVSKIGSGAPTQLSVDTNNFVKFNSPRGVAVNTNANSPYFGRVYVANSAAGTTATRPVGDGIYVLKPDLTDALGAGDTASTAGINFGTGGSSDPWHLGVGKDNKLYIGMFSTAAGMTWVTDPNVTTSTQVFVGIGRDTNPTVHTDSASTPIATGSLAGGDLVVYMIDGLIAPYNSIARWDIGAGPLPWNNPPTILGNAGIPSVGELTTDLEIGPDGKFYTSVNRSAGTDVASIKVFDTDGVSLLWDSLTVGGNPDPLRQTRSIMISPDGKYLACVHDDNHVTVLPLNGGIPDLTSMFTINFTPITTIGRDMAWDAADNIYTVSSGQALLRVYSLGFTTTAITSNDSTGTNGTFQLITPDVTANIMATAPDASESGPTAGTFTVTRTAADLGSPLTVNYTITGTASNGVDYVTLTNSVTIPVGQTTADITVTPIDDSVSELSETVTITLKGGAGYSAAAPTSATVTIADNDPQVLQISAIDNTMYERIANDYIRFRITRLGDLNAASYTVDPANITYGGTAVADTDFVSVNQSVSIDPGVVSVTNSISPLDNAVYSGNKTVVIGLNNGTGFTVTTNTVSGTIVDDENPTENVLLSDSLATDTSANWHTNFMANNLIDDYRVQWGYDLASDAVSAAPNGSTTALKVTLNKDEATANGSAGINLYLNAPVAIDNYALRFSMCLLQNVSAGTTEYVTFGINQSGNKTNWIPVQGGDLVNNTSLDNDGYWASVVADASGSTPGDYVLWRGNGAANPPLSTVTASSASFRQAFKNPPYSSGGGSGSPGSIAYNANIIWSDVEMKKFNNTVTVSINKTPVLTLANATNYTNGKIMLGYCDPFASVGDLGAAYFSNLRVISLEPPSTQITRIQVAGSNVTLSFSSSDNSDTTASFALLSASAVNGPYTVVTPAAVITQTGPGTFQAATTVSGATRFYRIQHL